jgi:thioesterase domain-containing protein/aryl carrier-like protein
LTALELLAELREAGVQIEADGDRLRVAAPKNALSDAMRAAIAAHKAELLRFLAPERNTIPELRAVPRVAREPLSPGQERLWALVSRAPDSRRYNLPLAFRVRGPLDVARLRSAVAAVIARHDVLRSVICTDASARWTELRDHDIADVVRLESTASDTSASWISRRVEAESNRLFDLATGPLIRLTVTPLGTDDHLLTIVMHHIVADGWSFEVFFDELAAAWDSHDQRAPLRLQYADVAAWQRSRLTDERRTQAVQFWRNSFAGTPAPLALPRPRSTESDLRIGARIPDACLSDCEALGTAEGTTPFVVCLAAYATYLAASTGGNEAILCTPAVGRERDELQGIIGYINNVLPLRLRVDEATTFRALVRQVRQDLLGALEWQDLPFQEIASLPETQRIPLTRGMFSYSGRSIRSLRLAGCAVQSLAVPDRSTDFDLGLAIEAGEATLSLRHGVLGTVAPAAFLDRYIAFLGDVTSNPDLTIGELRARTAPQVLEGGASHGMVQRYTPRAGTPVEGNDMIVGLTSDPLELQLALIWERLFDVHPIAPDANFFELGGHSLLAVSLLDTIEREMGTRLTLAVLAQHPTVRSLARVLTTKGWAPERGSLLRMRSGGPGIPLVLMHSFEGHLFLFNELADRLRVGHPVFGCQAVGIDGEATPLSSVEEMAAHYLALMDDQLGDGPIVLAAMCFGVSVALEMTRRRSDAGKPTHLMLIDSAWEHVVTPQSPGPRRSLPVRLWSRAMHELTRGRYWVQESLRMITGSPYARREARIRRRTAQAWLDYTPRPFDGRVTLLRTRPAEPTANDWKVESLEKLARGDFETIYVPGSHFTLLRAPDVSGLAAAMMAAVTRPIVSR